MCNQQSLRSACTYAQSDQSLCLSLEYSMVVKLLTKHHLEFQSLKGGCRGSSKSTLVKMPHCWKSLALAHMHVERRGLWFPWLVKILIVLFNYLYFYIKLIFTQKMNKNKKYYLFRVVVKTSFVLNTNLLGMGPGKHWPWNYKPVTIKITKHLFCFINIFYRNWQAPV